MACRLGCDPDYTVLITDRCNGSTVGAFEFDTLTWGRVLDGISEAKVTIPAGCCGKLANVRSWRHELHVIRADEEVWVGPIITQPNCRSGVTIQALDMLAWLGVRVIHEAHCYDPDCGGAPADPVLIAEALIRDGLEPDDPCLLEYLTVIAGGEAQERDYKAFSGYVLPALVDLARGGIDFTVAGRRIIVMPEGHSLGRTSMLTCEHFGGDVCTTEDGNGLATRAIVTGKAPDGTTVVSGSAGGVDPYYGLVEVLHDDETIKTASAASRQARGLVRNPAPLLVQPPQGSALTPEAPVCINELVPGVEVPAVLDCTCRTASAQMRLVKLDVTVNAQGEQVRPLLAPAAG